MSAVYVVKEYDNACDSTMSKQTEINLKMITLI